MKKVNIFRRLSLAFLACEFLLFMLTEESVIWVAVWGLLFILTLASVAIGSDYTYISGENSIVYFIAAILFAACGTLGLSFAYLMRNEPISFVAECCFAATCFCWAFEDWYRWIEARLAKINPSE